MPRRIPALSYVMDLNSTIKITEYANLLMVTVMLLAKSSPNETLG